MGADPIIASKFAIAIVGVVAALVAASNRTLLNLPQRQFDWVLYGTAIASRLGLFVFTYVVLGFGA